MRKTCLILTAVILFLSFTAPAFASPSSGFPVYEGPGCATPEDAVRLYLEGIQNEDLGKMLSAFAIETCVVRFDYTGQLRRIRSYIPVSSTGHPSVSNLFTAMNIESRKQEIVNAIKFQLVMFHLTDYDPVISTMFMSDDLDAEIAAFVKHFEDNLGTLALRDLELVGFIPPNQLSEMYDGEKNQEQLVSLAEICGADELRSVAALFTVDGKGYYLCCDALQYGDQWYLHKLGGSISSLLLIDQWAGGITPAP